MNKVSFFIQNIDTDLLIAINGNNNSPDTIREWICAHPMGQYWSELDENGFPVFCMYSQLFINNTCSLTDGSGNNPYTVEGTYFIKHPIHAPK